MGRVDVSRYQTFADITARLDEIIPLARDKDVSLERSLDLYDEAVELFSKATSLVDATDFSPEEEARLAEPVAAEGAAKDGGEPGEKDASEPAEAPVAGAAGDGK